MHLEPGSQVAVVGASGAGKSSLAGLLLGWHQPAAGRLLIDGQPLDAASLERLRATTAWVEPAIQLWNRSLLDNLLYGTDAERRPPLNAVLHDADLYDVLQRLPDGLQTTLGDSGGLLSGGQGQRVRLGRALHRQPARLVMLDEPFRGLDRGKRRLLLQRVRELRRGATLICITHDVGDTLSFDRVLVVEQGHVIEDGAPAELARQSGSRYRALLDSDEDVCQGAWSTRLWRRLWLEGGRLVPMAQGERQ